MILAIFHAGGQTRDKGDLIGSLITFFKNEIVLVFSLQIVSIFLSLVSHMFWSDVFALYTSFLSPPLIDISLVLFIVYLSKF